MEKNQYGERFIVRDGKQRTYKMPSHISGLKPYHIYEQELSVFPVDGKHGFARNIQYNEDTGVQVRYEYRLMRRYFMSDPEDHKEYWQRREQVRAAFRQMMWGKK